MLSYQSNGDETIIIISKLKISYYLVSHKWHYIGALNFLVPLVDEYFKHSYNPRIRLS